MLSIKNSVTNEIVIKKSKFITYLLRVDDITSVNNYIRDLNLKHNDSSHICYAYILDNTKRFNDDFEPNGTAGMPILNVLEENGLNHVLCCVVRYFGGIKLGANGLVRAYSNSASEVLAKASITNLVIGNVCRLTFNYNDTKVIDSILNNSIIINKEYGEDVSYDFKISLDDFNSIKDIIKKYGILKELDTCYIEKNINS